MKTILDGKSSYNFSGRLGSAKQNPTSDNQGYDRSMQYRRAKSPGSSYFFTLVTHNRRPILCEPENIDLLRDSFKDTVGESNLY